MLWSNKAVITSLLPDINPYGNSLNKNETVANRQYAGGYFDANTGLYKFGTRYYDPQTGRWTQKDPVGGNIGKIGSGNPYVYADNEPNMQVDPSGKDPILCALSVLAITVAIIGGIAGIIAAILTAAPVAVPAVVGAAADAALSSLVTELLIVVGASGVIGGIGGIFLAIYTNVCGG